MRLNTKEFLVFDNSLIGLLEAKVVEDFFVIVHIDLTQHFHFAVRMCKVGELRQLLFSLINSHKNRTFLFRICPAFMVKFKSVWLRKQSFFINREKS